jgi:Spy/CpxP family protein refolding chaperone
MTSRASRVFARERPRALRTLKEMNMKLIRKSMIAAAMTAALSTAAWAQPAWGPGMMGGYGYGPGYGMGPGMMGGYGYGPGYGMGPGMMGGYGYGPGYGMGPGMMGGYGYGPGMMGFGALSALNLTDAQRAKIADIQHELSQKHWELMGKAFEERNKLLEQFESGKTDDQAARKSYQAMAEARRQMFESSLDARKRIDAVLTPEQREQLRRGWRGGWGAPGPK